LEIVALLAKNKRPESHQEYVSWKGGGQMKKWLLIGVAFMVIVIIVLVIGISNLGPMIKTAVNTYGPKMTKTEVHLGDVDVSIFSAEAKLQDFYLGNPKGFKSPDAIKVGSIYVNVDEGSITGETIIIDKIEVVGPQITYEKARRTDNFKSILNNIEEAVSTGERSKKQAEKEGESKKILIRDFSVKDGKVNLATSIPGGKSISATLPDIHLKNVGQKEGGVSPAEAFKEVFAALYGEITSPAVADALTRELKAIGSEIEIGGDGTKKGIEGATLFYKPSQKCV
jgi:uncharacterized protein involved in outer membrane biogenesis